MKKRFKNWITSIIGIILIFASIFLYVAGKFYDLEISTLEFVTLLVLGWVFLTARDTLLEGLFLTVFKIGKKDEGKS